MTRHQQQEQDRALIVLLYATTGKEFEVEQSLVDLDLGMDVYCARKLEFTRVGKKREPVEVERPYLANYIFCDMEPQDIYRLSGVKYLSRTHDYLNPKDTTFSAFQRRVAAERAETERRIAEAKRSSEGHVCVFSPGDALQVVGGQFAGILGEFRRVVEVGEALRYEMDTAMGRMCIDPLDLKATG